MFRVGIIFHSTCTFTNSLTSTMTFCRYAIKIFVYFRDLLIKSVLIYISLMACENLLVTTITLDNKSKEEIMHFNIS